MNNSRIQELLHGNLDGFGTVPGRRANVRRVDTIVAIPLAQIRPDPDNARRHFDPEALQALADDMKRHGQMQNAVVWLDSTTGEYQLIAGERRLRAAKLAGLETLMCHVVPRELSQDIRQEMALAENLSRCDLKPTEVAAHWKKCMERWGCTTRDLAARVGVAQSTVSKRLALLKLDAETQRAVDAGEVKQTHAAASTSKRRHRPARRGQRGVLELAAGTIRVRRGQTLEALAAELAAHLAGEKRDAA